VNWRIDAVPSIRTPRTPRTVVGRVTNRESLAAVASVESLADPRPSGQMARLSRQGNPMAEQTFRIRSWVKASDADQRDGLVGFLTLFVGDLIVDNVTLRRTLAGRFSLSWPARTDRLGRKSALVRPVDRRTRERIEREVLRQLAQREDLGAPAGDRP
jgi:hypothetical protein